jgi:hypothetical protein
LALPDKEQCKLTSDLKDLKDRAVIESDKEGKRSVLRPWCERAGRGVVLQRDRGLQCDQGLFGVIQATQPPIGSQMGWRGTGQGPPPDPPPDPPQGPQGTRKNIDCRLPMSLRGAMAVGTPCTRVGPRLGSPAPCTRGTRCSRTSPRQPNTQYAVSGRRGAAALPSL